MRSVSVPILCVLLGALASTTSLQLPAGASSASYTLDADPTGWTFPAWRSPNPPLVGSTGQPIAVTVRWTRTTENFAVYPPGYPLGQVALGNPAALARSPDVSSIRRAATLEFTLHAPGDYLYVSEHRPSAMAGTLMARGPPTPNEAPALGAIDVMSLGAVPGQEVRLQAVATDPDGDALAYRWEFGDGAASEGRTGPGGGTIHGAHAYRGSDAYEVRLEVDDRRGGIARASATVDVVGAGLLRVATEPSLPAAISVDGVRRDEWGLSWMKIEPGDHTVAFADVPGFRTPEPVRAALEEGATTEVTGRYEPLGWLRVVTDPPVPGTIAVDGIPRNDWGMWTAMDPGIYTVEFGPVARHAVPPPQSVSVVAGALTTVVGRYAFDGISPGPDPATYGFLRVVTDPPVPSQIRVDGVPRDDWGLAWLKLAPGSYEVRATDVPGYGSPPSRTVTIVPGQTTSVQLTFAAHGWLRVSTEPAVPATIFVDGIPRNDWGVWRAIPAGTYTIAFGPVQGALSPPARQVTVAARQTTHVRAVFAQEVFGDMDWPTALALSPDGRVFIAERTTGTIHVARDGIIQATPFARLPNTSSDGEQGLLGLALHPAFPDVPWVYAYQTYADPVGSLYNRIVRLRADGDVSGATEVVLAPIPAALYHNGGVLAFGPDGRLHAGLGDAGAMEAAQDLRVLNGKTIRMNPDGTVPLDNPFVGRPQANPYVYTYGHRNVFGLAFHPATGAAYVTENGPEDSDEVNLLVPGGNYGWPVVRGDGNRPPYRDPIATWTPTIAPTNAIVYSGSRFPELVGDLILGDWNTGSLRRLDLAAPGYDVVGSETVLLAALDGIIDVELARDGAIWFTTHRSIYRYG